MLGLFAQQRVAILLGDLIVIGVDFAEGQEAVAVAAIFDERRLERGLHAGYLGQIDIALELPALGGLEINPRFGWLTGAPSWAGTIREIDVQSNRIVIQFDERVAAASSFVLAGPNRIALDLAGAAPGARADAGGPVSSVRQARAATGSRVVFDLARPAIVTQGRFSADGTALTLELRTVDDSRFRPRRGRRTDELPAPLQLHPRVEPPQLQRLGPRAAAPGRVQAARIQGDDESRPLVVIDAGHGGHDPGAISADGLQEKDLTLKTARAIRDELLSSGRVRVAMTREDDRYLLHRDRFEIARKLGAALFISVHCDAAHNAEASGATVYTLPRSPPTRSRAPRRAREQVGPALGHRPWRTESRGFLDPDRSGPARDDEQLGQVRPAARPRGAGADAGQGQLPPHGLAVGAQGPRRAVDPVRDRLYLERKGRSLPQFRRWPPPRGGKREPCGRHPFATRMAAR
ncbi:n-acetylmuramoyl-L-alanine amidase domain-containing protein [Ditylenchus destructor]|uniref:N-acetylmuramoyl-L-alanine amidase domain-containing protein n=1 Tax=Ditylenchus destructor TaxID=166010 RepID=A0AAD4QVQ5_9BILA|nr:n-acetylmuramoyl-L-alanine amidase domain-containing protein [Ditylenchus destructor]